MLQRSLSLLVSVTIAGAGFGCVQPDDGNQPEEPPEFPSMSIMTPDLSILDSAPPAAKRPPVGTATFAAGDLSGVAPQDYANFGNAWVRLVVLELWTATILAIPTIVLAAVLQDVPDWRADRGPDGNGAWVWSVTYLGHTAELELSLKNNETGQGWRAEMYVSNATLSRFLWMSADANPFLTTGTWTFHSANQPEGDNAVLSIGWNYVDAANSSLVFTNLDSQSDGTGDVYTFSREGTHMKLHVTDADVPGSLARIEWFLDSSVGGIEVPEYNGGEPACWDSAFVNVACPEGA